MIGARSTTVSGCFMLVSFIMQIQWEACLRKHVNYVEEELCI